MGVESRENGQRELIEVGDYFIDVTGKEMTPEIHLAVEQAARSYSVWEKADQVGGDKVHATVEFQSAWTDLMKTLNIEKPVVLHRSELEVATKDPVAVG